MFCGNREGISNLLCSTLVSVNVQCSIALLLILHIVMSFSIMRLTLFFASRFVYLIRQTDKRARLWHWACHYIAIWCNWPILTYGGKTIALDLKTKLNSRCNLANSSTAPSKRRSGVEKCFEIVLITSQMLDLDFPSMDLLLWQIFWDFWFLYVSYSKKNHTLWRIVYYQVVKNLTYCMCIIRQK